MFNVEAPTQAIRRRFRAGMWRTKMHNAVSRTEAKQRLPKGFCSALRTETTLEQGKVWPGFKDADSHAISSATLGQHTLGYSSLPVGKKTILTGRSGVTDLSNGGGVSHGAGYRAPAKPKERWEATETNMSLACDGKMYGNFILQTWRVRDGYPVDDRDFSPADFMAFEKRTHSSCRRCGKVAKCKCDDRFSLPVPDECKAVIENIKSLKNYIPETVHPRLHVDFPDCRDEHCVNPEHELVHTLGTSPERLTGPTTDASLRPNQPEESIAEEWITLQAKKEQLVQHYYHKVNSKGFSMEVNFSPYLWKNNLNTHADIVLDGCAGRLGLKQQMSAWPKAGDVSEWVSLNLEQRKLHPYVAFERTQHQTVLERELRPVESINFGWHAYIYKSAKERLGVTDAVTAEPLRDFLNRMNKKLYTSLNGDKKGLPYRECLATHPRYLASNTEATRRLDYKGTALRFTGVCSYKPFVKSPLLKAKSSLWRNLCGRRHSFLPFKILRLQFQKLHRALLWDLAVRRGATVRTNMLQLWSIVTVGPHKVPSAVFRCDGICNSLNHRVCKNDDTGRSYSVDVQHNFHPVLCPINNAPRCIVRKYGRREHWLEIYSTPNPNISTSLHPSSKVHRFMKALAGDKENLKNPEKPMFIKGDWKVRLKNGGQLTLSEGGKIRDSNHAHIDRALPAAKATSWTAARTHCNLAYREFKVKADEAEKHQEWEKNMQLAQDWYAKATVCEIAGGTVAKGFELEPYGHDFLGRSRNKSQVTYDESWAVSDSRGTGDDAGDALERFLSIPDVDNDHALDAEQVFPATYTEEEIEQGATFLENEGELVHDESDVETDEEVEE